jgi:hypothetical protein
VRSIPPTAGSSADLVLDNGRAFVSFDATDGRVVAVGHHELAVSLVSERRLAENWRLGVLLPDGFRRIGAAGQALASATIADTSATLAWETLVTGDGVLLDLGLVQVVRLEGDAITATLRLENHSGAVVEEVAPFCLGGLANWQEQDDWQICVPSSVFGGEEWRFYAEFPGTYIGFDRPAFCFTYPGTSIDYWHQNLSMPWGSLYNARRRVAVYIGNHNPEISFSGLWGELHPAGDRANPGGRASPELWPHPGRADSGIPIGVTVGWVHFPLVGEGRRYESPPAVVRFHEGTWWESASLYREWFDEHVGRVEYRPGGLAEIDAWQCTYLAAPDAPPRHRFDDLPAIALDALDAGIETIMIAGWHEGGLDSNYPAFGTPSESLGGHDELERGIRESQELGVRVLLWANANQISLDHPSGNELLRYANRDPAGRPHRPIGFGFFRLLSVLGYTTPWMVGGNLAHEGFRDLILAEWEKVAALGPDAMLVDKLICGEPYHLDLGPDAPGEPSSGAHSALADAVGALARRLDRRAPPIGLALETAWDRLMPYGEALYLRHFGQDHVPVREVAFPEVKASCCICGDFDFGLVNNAIRFGHILAVEALRLWGTCADLPNLAPYIREVLRLRRELRDNLWLSRVVQPTFARVCRGEPVRVGALQSWVESPTSGTPHALVLHHFDPEPQTVDVELLGSYRRAVVHRPYVTAEDVGPRFSVEIPRDQLAVVLPFI